MFKKMLILFGGLVLTLATPAAAHADDSKSPWLAATLNWFLPGTGYMYNGQKPLYSTVPMLAGALALTYVENFHEFDDGKTLLEHDKQAFGILFGAVLVINTGLAIDAYQEANSINANLKKTAAAEPTWQFDVLASQNGDDARYGLQLRGTF